MAGGDSGGRERQLDQLYAVGRRDGRWMLYFENDNGEQRQEPAATHEIAVGALIAETPLGGTDGGLIYPMSVCPGQCKGNHVRRNHD